MFSASKVSQMIYVIFYPLEEVRPSTKPLLAGKDVIKQWVITEGYETKLAAWHAVSP